MSHNETQILDDEPITMMGRVVPKQLRDNAGAFAILARMEQAVLSDTELDSYPDDFEPLDPETVAHCMLFWDAAAHYLSPTGVKDKGVKANIQSIWAHFPAPPIDQLGLADDDQAPSSMSGTLRTVWDDAGVLFDPESSTVFPIRVSVDIDLVVSPMSEGPGFAEAIADAAYTRVPDAADDDGYFLVEVYLPYSIELHRGARRATGLTASDSVTVTARRKGK